MSTARRGVLPGYRLTLGVTVAAYIRPHDVSLGRASGARAVAEVLRCTRVGGVVKVEVRLASGDLLIVQLSAAEAEALAIRDGDRVGIDVRTARVFVGDYAI